MTKCFSLHLNTRAPYSSTQKAFTSILFAFHHQVATFPARGGAAIDAAVMADVASRILIGGLKLGATTGENGGSGGSAADVTGDGLKVPLQTLGAATFRTGTVGANGQKASVGVLVKLEALNNTYRLSVRAVHGKISLAFKNVVKAQLA
jgi:hypothetical protein